ncbi:D-alanyl-D-alanine carboxypeptidase [Parabacteroides distasonis]|nr:D-alanyl-D-alanine carboxypeptidase [Parabacteroides distasonis]
MIRKISFFFLISCLYLSVGAQTPQPIKQFLRKPYMEGASFSLIVKEVNSGETVFAYDTIRQLTPASVMKTVTTATALEILGRGLSLSYGIRIRRLHRERLVKRQFIYQGKRRSQPWLSAFCPGS